MPAVNFKAREFVERWKDKGSEDQDSHKFWFDFFENVLECSDPYEYLDFERKVEDGKIDIYVNHTKVIIEQKSRNVSLTKPKKQSDGSLLTPFEQAKRYDNKLGVHDKANWIIICNFKALMIYDMASDPNGHNPIEIQLQDIPGNTNLVRFLIDDKFKDVIIEQQLSFKAGKLIAKLYDALKPRYKDPDNENSLKSLNKLCVRLVFCLYAEDAGLFNPNDNHMFGNYLKQFSAREIRRRLIDLFAVLNQRPEEREVYLEEDDPDLAKFPYVNGNLFKFESKETEEIPPFTDEIKHLLITECSDSLDWSKISPTIFGALFESTLNQVTRRVRGMHYTSVENIHKVIDPLFLDDLKEELKAIKKISVAKKKELAVVRFQDKLASLKFLDPACGSGNFLTETYICLRRLENELIRSYTDVSFLESEDFNPVKVSINQCYGIEINDFAVAVANTALWIAESQMLQETESIIKRSIEFFPLRSHSNIYCANALRIDWNAVVPKTELSYIIGNPPFSGARTMIRPEKEDVELIWADTKNRGNLDYVTCWYRVAADYIKDTGIQVSLVSTNSICQGEQAGILWNEMFSRGMHINKAYQTFVWDSEADEKAHVYCVIVQFAAAEEKSKTLFIKESQRKVSYINQYLTALEVPMILSRSKPLCSVPEIGIGNKPVDGGFYLFTEEEMREFINREPGSQKYFKKWYGADELLNNYCRYCLWLGDCEPHDLKGLRLCAERVKKVREYRLASKSEGTRKLADKPTRFHVENMPEANYIVIPKVSSEKRRYVPMSFMTPDVFASDLLHILPNASSYDFGILESIVHMAWLRMVTGRLKSDYRYSKDIVYNNFIWPKPSNDQRSRVEKTANGILAARKLHPDSSLSELYNDDLMPFDLRRAHEENDKAVLELYGLEATATEEDIVKKLFKMYSKKIRNGQ